MSARRAITVGLLAGSTLSLVLGAMGVAATAIGMAAVPTDASTGASVWSGTDDTGSPPATPSVTWTDTAN